MCLTPRIHGRIIPLFIIEPTPATYKHGLLQPFFDVLRPLRHGAFIYFYCVPLTPEDGLEHLEDVEECVFCCQEEGMVPIRFVRSNSIKEIGKTVDR